MVSRSAASVSRTKIVQRRRPQPVWKIGIHPTCEQQAEALGVAPQVRTASIQYRWHPCAGSEETYDKVALAECACGRKDSATPAVRRARVCGYTAHYFVVLTHPYQVIRIEHPAVFDEQLAQLWRLRHVSCASRRIDPAVGIGTMREQQLDHLSVPCAGGNVQRRSARSVFTFRKVWIGAAVKQQLNNVTVSELQSG